MKRRAFNQILSFASLASVVGLSWLFKSAKTIQLPNAIIQNAHGNFNDDLLPVHSALNIWYRKDIFQPYNSNESVIENYQLAIQGQHLKFCKLEGQIMMIQNDFEANHHGTKVHFDLKANQLFINSNKPASDDVIELNAFI